MYIMHLVLPEIEQTFCITAIFSLTHTESLQRSNKTKLAFPM